MPPLGKRLVIDDLRRGRNGFDPPWAIADNESADAVNLDFYKTRLGSKRGGMAAAAVTGITCTGIISSAFRHVPSTDETLAELWMVDDSATPIINRLAGSATVAAPTLKDAPTGNGWDFTSASINGKLVLAYKSAQDRLHCWDGSTVRRLGLAATGAPTAANNGSGTYATVLRYYRQRSTVQVAGVTVRRSEASASVSITPSGSGLQVRVTQATVVNEGETHWEIEASTDNITFYRIATVAIATTTYDDSAATTSYSTNPLSALTGVYTLFTSVKFVAADQNRLLGFGNHTAANKQARVWISAVIGSSDIGDDERIDTSAVNSYVDLDENDSGVPTGLMGPILGSYFAFKYRQVFQLTATGSTAQPYRQDAISKKVGAIGPMAIITAEDKYGNAAIYWMSHRGPYRWTINGLEYLGQNVEDYVLGGNATINLAAAKRAAVVTYHPDKRQVWFWWATGSSDDCNVGFIFDVQSNGWTRVPTGDKWANVRCAVPFSVTIGASMSRNLKPYVGQTGAASRIWMADTGTDDNGTAFQAYFDTKCYEPGGAGYQGTVGDIQLLAKVSSGVTITSTTTSDFGFATTTGTAVLTAGGAETRAVVRVADSCLAGGGSGPTGAMRFVQYRMGDAAAVSNTWALDRMVIPYDRTAPDTQ